MGYGVFEQWSERRRRWFLVTFCAVSWTFFANSLAHLGESIAHGGIGPDAVHALGVIGTLAMWTAVWGTFKLSMRRWVFAALCGVTVSAAIVESGLRDGAAAAIWSVQCDDGNSTACIQLAEYFDAGRSPIHGWLDARRLHDRACALGPSASCDEPAATTRSADLRARCFDDRIVSDCAALALEHRLAGALDAMYEVEHFACSELSDIGACTSLMNSGYHHLQRSACDVVVPHCRTSSAPRCAVDVRYCERVSSPYAGVD